MDLEVMFPITKEEPISNQGSIGGFQNGKFDQQTYDRQYFFYENEEEVKDDGAGKKRKQGKKALPKKLQSEVIPKQAGLGVKGEARNNG